MYDYHSIVAAAAIFLGFVGLALYIRSIFRGETKPHIFTWFCYALIDGIIFAAQVSEGGGAGAWVTFSSLVGIFTICVLAWKRGERRVTSSDWVVFAAALLGIALWRATSEPLFAVVILTVTNTLAVIPTARKSFGKPFQESVSLWIMDIGKFGIGIFALSSITVTTALFPVGIVLTNSALVIMILYRRHIHT